MVEWVQRVVRERRIDCIFAFSSQVAPYALPYVAERRSVMDFVDVDSEKWRQYATEARPGPRKLIYRREARLLLALEKQAARQFDASLFVSEAEWALFRRLAGSYAHTVVAVNNGVDFDYFDPEAECEPRAAVGGPAVVFSGAMDYRPNIDAALWFADQVWPRVRAARPSSVFQIVGSKPAPEVQQLAGREGIVVTGRVEDMRPYLAGAAVVVAPLRIARGVQNKVLEAMAMARPVVFSGEGVASRLVEESGAGLAVSPGDARALADALAELAADPARRVPYGAAGRATILERFNRATVAAKIEASLLRASNG